MMHGVYLGVQDTVIAVSDAVFLFYWRTGINSTKSLLAHSRYPFHLAQELQGLVDKPHEPSREISSFRGWEKICCAEGHFLAGIFRSQLFFCS